MDDITLQERVKIYMKKHGTKQKHLAALVGISESKFSLFMRGETHINSSTIDLIYNIVTAS